jgi:hypothetical protein
MVSTISAPLFSNKPREIHETGQGAVRTLPVGISLKGCWNKIPCFKYSLQVEGSKLQRKLKTGHRAVTIGNQRAAKSGKTQGTKARFGTI